MPVFPQASVTVHDLVVVRVQPVPDSAPIVPVAVNPVLQLSVAVAAPNAAAICGEVGLQPRADALARVITGDVISCTVIVCVQVAELPHASVAVHFLAIE